MTRNEYNGWTNYETWVVNLWLNNEQGSQDYWLNVAEWVLHHSKDEDAARYELASIIENQHEESLPELTGFAADLLNASMSEVNWHEIAEHFIDAAKEQVTA